jgi:DNA-binding NtrC family response regulator
VNCGAIPVELAENELFGHERGAFTGAHASHHGLIAQADGGTLFLDEIASLPLLTQVKLLRFLQEHEYRPIGCAMSRHANVRVIAAANTNLEEAVHKGQFRKDLFYRLSIIRVALPPLRQRRDDIPLLAEYFLRKHGERLGRPGARLDATAAEKLIRHDWPGNVRELEHGIERALVFSTGPIVGEDLIHLSANADASPPVDSFKEAKAKTVAHFERCYIEGLLAAHQGNISHAARRAGKNRRAFWELIRKYGVEPQRFRPLSAAEVEV